MRRQRGGVGEGDPRLARTATDAAHQMGRRTSLGRRSAQPDRRLNLPRLLRLYGGFLVDKANHVLPTETIIVAATGERYRGVCNYKSHDTWNWSLQTSRAAGFEGASHLECSVCMSALRHPVKWPAHPERWRLRARLLPRLRRALPVSGADERLPAVPRAACRWNDRSQGEEFADGRRRCGGYMQPTPWSRSSASPCRSTPSPTRRPTGRLLHQRAATTAAMSPPPPPPCRPPSRFGAQAAPCAPGATHRQSIPSATEAEQRRLLWALVYTKPTSVEQPGKHTAVRQMELGVEADFLASVSKADLAVFLAVLTEMYWARERQSESSARS